MRTLDRTRSYGTVIPPHKGVSYQQDGRDFDHEGHEVLPEGARPPPTPPGYVGGDTPVQPEPEQGEREIAPGVPEDWRSMKFLSLRQLVKEKTGVLPKNGAEAVMLMERWLQEQQDIDVI